MTIHQKLIHVVVNITPDDYSAFSYAFDHAGTLHECHDFPSEAEALSGAHFHIQCLTQGLPHEVCDGLGAIYRPSNPYTMEEERLWQSIVGSELATTEHVTAFETATGKKHDRNYLI